MTRIHDHEQDRRLRERLTELEALLREQRSPVVDHWRPGLPAHVVRRLAVERLGRSSPPELEVWYGWHDGSDRTTGDASRVVPDRFLLSLAQSIEYYGLQRRVAEQVGREDAAVAADDLWHPAWFPFTVNSSGDALVLDLRHDPAPVLSVIVHDRDRGLPAAPSLADAVGFWTMLIGRGLWRYDPDLGWVIAWDDVPPELERHPLL